MRQRANWGLILVAAMVLVGCQNKNEKNYGIVNTPLIIQKLTGAWQRDVTTAHPQLEVLTFKPDGSGSIQQSATGAPANMTYRVDGFDLTIQYYFDESVPRNWRTRTLVYQYKLTDDMLTLVLVRHGEVETWRKK